MNDNSLKQFIPTLVSLADGAESTQTVQFHGDLNGDGATDEINIRYEKDHYVFAVKLGKIEKTNRISLGPLQKIKVPLSEDRVAFQKLRQTKRLFAPRTHELFTTPDSFPYHTREGILRWEKLIGDYPLLNFFEHPAFARFKNYFALLFRSPAFREQVARFLEEGNVFRLVPHGAFQYDPEKKLLTVPADATHIAFLSNFPHEFHHPNDDPLDKRDVASFIDSYCRNEVRANIFAIGVIDEAGLLPDSHWGSFHDMHATYRQGGEEALLGLQKREIMERTMLTYVEQAWLVYDTRNSADPDSVFNERAEVISRERRQIVEGWDEWFAVFQDSAAHLEKDIDKTMRLPEVRRLEDSHPSSKTFIGDQRAKWQVALSLLITTKDGQVDVDAERRANVITAGIRQDYFKKEMERIRLENARRLGLERYY